MHPLLPKRIAITMVVRFAFINAWHYKCNSFLFIFQNKNIAATNNTTRHIAPWIECASTVSVSEDTNRGTDSLSPEANAVLLEGKKLWQAYFAQTDVHTVRDELKLNRADVGWYQIRKALEARNASGDFPPVSFAAFKEAYNALTEKLQPMVYELGFLKN